MKKIKSFFQIVLILVLLLTLITYILPKQIKLSQTLQIEASGRLVFNQVNDLLNWQRWMSWQGRPLPVPTHITRHALGEQAAISWPSARDQQAGQLKIQQTANEDSLQAKLNFSDEGSFSFQFQLIPEDNHSVSMKISLQKNFGNHPILRWKGLFQKKHLRRTIRESSINLKIVSEAVQRENLPLITLKHSDALMVISRRQRLTKNEVSSSMGKLYQRLNQQIETRDLTITGIPYSIYHQIKGDTIDFEAGYPVDHLIKVEPPFYSYRIPAQLYVTADHYGGFETLGDTHQLIQRWITRHGFRIASGPMEQYISDPHRQADSSSPATITIISYPVK